MHSLNYLHILYTHTHTHTGALESLWEIHIIKKIIHEFQILLFHFPQTFGSPLSNSTSKILWENKIERQYKLSINFLKLLVFEISSYSAVIFIWLLGVVPPPMAHICNSLLTEEVDHSPKF